MTFELSEKLWGPLFLNFFLCVCVCVCLTLKFNSIFQNLEMAWEDRGNFKQAETQGVLLQS